MAGIGFELKKLFSRRGLIATFRAYGYATMVCAGPMLLGFLLILSSMLLADLAGASRHNRELMVSILTHAMLASLVLTSLFSMLTTRFCSDMLYEKRYSRIMPSFYGSLWMMLIPGSLLFGVFLWFSGVLFVYRLLCYLLFVTLIVVWTEITYLTMLKNFRSIIVAFAVSVAAALSLGAILIWWAHWEPVTALLTGILTGYMIMAVWYFHLIYQYFPEGYGTSARFLAWFDFLPQLGFTGFFVTIGLFGHIVIMWWCSRLSVQVEGLFYGAPGYDVPAIFAFFSILITTVNFCTTVETRFYPRYREYFGLFNGGGSIENINDAERSMIRVLADELGYMCLKQIFTTMIFVIFGTVILPMLPLGFNTDMLRIFRNLCVGYAFYAIGNSIMLCSQYFSDISGAFAGAAIFALFTNAGSLIIALTADSFYGFGFLIGSMLFAFFALLRLCFYLTKLKYHVLSKQPLFVNRSRGFFTKIADFLDRRAEKVQARRKKYDEKQTRKKEMAYN